MPSKPPITLREELLAIDKLGLAGLAWFTKCDQRSGRFYEKAAASMFMNYTPPNSDELGWWFLGFNTESDKIVFRRFGLSPGSCPFLFFVSFLSGGRMPNDQ